MECLTQFTMLHVNIALPRKVSTRKTTLLICFFEYAAERPDSSLHSSLLFSFSSLFSYHSCPPPQIPSSTFHCTTRTISAPPQFSLLIGILTRADKYDRRHFLRLVYGIQSSPVAHIDVKFIFCNLTKPEQRVLVALEILRFEDVIILNCMGEHEQRQDLHLLLIPPADSPATNPFVEYMSGMGFVLSWDLVEWIGESDIPGNDTFGPEDSWLEVVEYGEQG
ncbi:hypothetical protein CK203_105202 [Vitis vinifera]|uniref:Hexosyltransferase n=1 Tax=Vitis vinifera TaxID=29760 RepID=A0A438CBI8_VITVI|nr:hypothetical protein CK203_105202 [Vitis vinifera]